VETAPTSVVEEASLEDVCGSLRDDSWTPRYVSGEDEPIPAGKCRSCLQGGGRECPDEAMLEKYARRFTTVVLAVLVAKVR
jgi:hypothetical protein